MTSGLPAGIHFGVFVDRPPIRPGHAISALADQQCKRTPGCPSPDYLQTLGVYITEGTSLVFDTLPDTNAGKHHQTKETQRVTVIYLDSQNRRISESAFALEFFLNRRGTS